MNSEYIIKTIVKPKINEAINLVESCRYVLIGKTMLPEDVLLSEKFEDAYKSLSSLSKVISLINV